MEILANQKTMERCIKKRRIRSLSLLLDLPESLFLEILYRLPVKSLFKFKSVSKHWLSMISDPSFARSYSCRRTKCVATFLYRYEAAIYRTPEDMQRFSLDDLWPTVLHHHHPFFRSPKFKLQFLSKYFKQLFNFDIDDTSKMAIDDPNQTGNVKAPVVVQAISNGLLLSASTLMYHDYYYIINPFTQQYSALPKPLRVHKLVIAGFIAEPIDGSFIVVRIGGYGGKSNVLNFEVFSSKTGEWRDKTASFKFPVGLFSLGGSCTSMYIVVCQRIFYLLEYGWRVIVFDPEEVAENEKTIIQCLLIDLPAGHDIRHERSAGMIAVCEDKNLLRYCQVTNMPLIQKLRVWELRKTEEKEHYWCFLHQVRVNNLITSIPENIRVLAVDIMNPDIVFIRNQRTMLLTKLNLKTRVFKRLFTFKSAMYPWTFFPYVLPPWPTPIPRITSP